MGAKALIGARAIGGLLTLAVIAGACSSADTRTLDVTSGPVPDATSTTATPIEVATTAAPLPAAAAAPRTAGRRVTPAPTAAAPTSTALTLVDTGLTRVRVVIENQARWATLTMHGTEIKASRVVETSGGTRVTSLGPQLGVAEPGRAVMEFVLAVAPGADTSLSMCKNIHGPATITVTRLTDAPTTIASITNYASEARNSSHCEGYMTADLTRPALVGPVRWPARNDPRPLVLANFYPWYGSAGAGGGLADQPTGPVDTTSPSSLASAVGLAKTHGIDGFIVEYEGSPAFDPNIDAVFRAAENQGGFFAALMLDFEILKGRPQRLSAAVLDAALNAVAQRASRSSQLEVNGQPVAFLFGGSLVDPSEWAAAVQRLHANTGLRPFFVADGNGMNGTGRHVYSTNDCPDVPCLLRWATGTLFNLRAQPALVGQSGPLWVAPVSPGYDDRSLDRPSHRYIDRRGTQRYNESWSAALDTLPDWIVITSWNEYYEQTHVMPGTRTGNAALERTAAWAAQFHKTG